METINMNDEIFNTSGIFLPTIKYKNNLNIKMNPKLCIEGHPLYKGFILIREYPGSLRKVGDFEPYTSGDFLRYPEIWSPVLHDHIARDNKIDDILDESIDTLE